MNYGIARLISSTGEVYEVKQPALSLGRATDNQVVIASSKSSRYHALITFVEGQYIIRDLESKNGTRVNGHLIEAEQVLRHGDRVSLADAQFTFELVTPDDNTVTATHDPTTDPEIATKTPALAVDLAAMEVKLAGHPLNPPLSLLEWKLLVLLYQNRGKVCSRDLIIETVYQPADPQSIPFDTAIETLVSRLRKRLLMSDAGQLPYIKVIRGVGYRLDL